MVKLRFNRKLRITGTFYSLSFLVFIAYNVRLALYMSGGGQTNFDQGSYDPEGLHYFDATAVDPSTQFLVQPVSLQNNASRCKVRVWLMFTLTHSLRTIPFGTW